MRAFPFIVLALAVLALAAGWLVTPRYRPPADSGEGRLRARAVEYYRASRLFDYATMSRLFTPARQLAETDELKAQIKEKRETFASLKDKTREDLAFSAESIDAEAIDIRVEGDWAVAGGECEVIGESGPLASPLSNTVWVRDAGDWWVYSLTVAELNAYGNPPDFAREQLELRDPLMVEQAAPGS